MCSRGTIHPQRPPSGVDAAPAPSRDPSLIADRINGSPRRVHCRGLSGTVLDWGRILQARFSVIADCRVRESARSNNQTVAAHLSLDPTHDKRVSIVARHKSSIKVLMKRGYNTDLLLSNVDATRLALPTRTPTPSPRCSPDATSILALSMPPMIV